MLTLDMFIWFLLGIQIGCFLVSITKRINPWEILGGFSIWGCVPIILLNLIK